MQYQDMCRVHRREAHCCLDSAGGELLYLVLDVSYQNASMLEVSFKANRTKQYEENSGDLNAWFLVRTLARTYADNFNLQEAKCQS